MVHAKRDFYDSVYSSPTGYSLEEGSTDVTARFRELSAYDLADGRVLEIGCGRAAMAGSFADYHGVDLSIAAVNRTHARTFAASAERLPFRDGSFSFIFSYHLLEHLDDPQAMLDEIVRLLAPGGVAFLKPAWNCRWWITEKISTKPYALLSVRHRIVKFLLPVLSSVAFRALQTLPKRIVAEFRHPRSPRRLRFIRLVPNFDFDQYWIADADASVSIDSHDVIQYLRASGCEVLSHPNALRRVLSRAEGIAFTLPSDRAER